jgi:4-amino-4-deoxy-L-arabinose transferase-like glycosyltransferase
MGYLLVPVILGGGSERAAHLLQILLVSIAILAMVKLALRLGFNEIQAAIAGMLMTAIPPLLSMASTAMPDIAALTLGLTGMERVLAWKEERLWHQALIASLALGLAPYCQAI